MQPRRTPLLPCCRLILQSARRRGSRCGCHGPGRFERKKGIALAVKALHEFLSCAEGAPPSTTLVLAGGFDARLPENLQHLQELKDLVGCAAGGIWAAPEPAQCAEGTGHDARARGCGGGGCNACTWDATGPPTAHP